MLLSVFEIAIEGGFKCVDVNQSVVEAEVDSSCLSLVLLCGKSAVIKLNCWANFTAKKRKDSDDVWVFMARVSIKETIHSKNDK